MTSRKNTVDDLFERLRRRSPKLLDLMLAETEEDFDEALIPFLESAVHTLEMRKKEYVSLNEDGLSGTLGGFLDIPGLLIATRETDSNGHVDLTIVLLNSFPLRKKLCEAKIYRGPGYHISGISQLLGRYTTGREGMGFLIVYVRCEDIKGKFEKLKDKMDETLPERQTGPCEPYSLRWSLLTKHVHSSGEIVSLGHIGCNLYVDGTSTS